MWWNGLIISDLAYACQLISCHNGGKRRQQATTSELKAATNTAAELISLTSFTYWSSRGFNKSLIFSIIVLISSRVRTNPHVSPRIAKRKLPRRNTRANTNTRTVAKTSIRKFVSSRQAFKSQRPAYLQLFPSLEIIVI